MVVVAVEGDNSDLCGSGDNNACISTLVLLTPDCVNDVLEVEVGGRGSTRMTGSGITGILSSSNEKASDMSILAKLLIGSCCPVITDTAAASVNGTGGKESVPESVDCI